MNIGRKSPQKSEVVEVNLKNSEACIVESSDAPELTHDLLAIKAKPIQIVQLTYDGKPYHVHIRHGMRFVDELKSNRIRSEYGVDASTNFMLSQMIASPKISWNGEGDGSPIEDIPPLLKDRLAEACLAVNNPTEDDIYQVEVCLGVPDDILKTANTLFPTQKPNDMTDADIIKNGKAYNMARQTLVIAMLASPVLSESECEETDTYPVSGISEGMMQTLYNAVCVVNLLRSTQTV